MADTAVVVLLGILTLLPLIFTILLYKRLVIVVFFIVMTILAGSGYYVSTGSTGQNIFIAYGTLGMIGLFVSVLMLILETLREYLSMIKGRV